MTAETPSRYPAPVEKLLHLGQPHSQDVWRDYTQLGIRPEHMPDLLSLVADHHYFEDDRFDHDDHSRRGSELYGPVHAWRALGQLRAVEVVKPLLKLADDEERDDWVTEDIPAVIALIGPAAIPAVAEWLEGQADFPIVGVEALKLLALDHPEVRDQCVALMTRQLEISDDRDLNGWIVAMLLDLSAKEAAPAMETAFAERRVDPTIAGNWQNVQYELRMTDRKPEHWCAEEPDEDEEGWEAEPNDFASRPVPDYRTTWTGGGSPRESAEKRKKKRKAAAKARNRNRKK